MTMKQITIEYRSMPSLCLSKKSNAQNTNSTWHILQLHNLRLAALASVASAADDLSDGMPIDGMMLGFPEAGQADGHGSTAGIPSTTGTTTGGTVTRTLVVHNAQPTAHAHGLLDLLLNDGGQHGTVVVADPTAKGGTAARTDDGAVAIVVLAGRAGQLGPLAVLGGILLMVERLILGGHGRHRRGRRVVRVTLGLAPHEDGAGGMDGAIVGMEPVRSDGRHAGMMATAAAAAGDGMLSRMDAGRTCLMRMDATRGDVRLKGGGSSAAAGRMDREAGTTAAGVAAVVRAGMTHGAAVAAAVTGLTPDRRPPPVHEGLDGLATLHLRDGPVGQDGLDLLPPLLLLHLRHRAAPFDGRGRSRPAPLRIAAAAGASDGMTALRRLGVVEVGVAHRRGALLRRPAALPPALLRLDLALAVLVVPLGGRMMRVGGGRGGIRPVHGSLVRSAQAAMVGVGVHHFFVHDGPRCATKVIYVSIKIGRWAQTNAAGRLKISALLAVLLLQGRSDCCRIKKMCWRNAGDSRRAGLLRQKEALNDSIFCLENSRMVFHVGAHKKASNMLKEEGEVRTW